MTDTELRAALCEPFPAEAIGWKAQSVKNGRALAVAYIDARDVMRRLDDVLGPLNWTDDYTALADGSIMCRLSVRLPGGDWVTKCDVGGASDQPDAGDRLKAAFSDALKRAAVKLGVGRYIYEMPHSWVDYDPVKKQIVNPPAIPAKFLPRSKKPATAAPAPAPVAPPPVAPPPVAPPADPVRAAVQAAKPTLSNLGLQLLERLTEAGDEGLVRTAWSHVYNCFARKEISEAEYNALTRLKDAQKARFAPPPA